MQNVFGLREHLIEEYAAFSRSFTRVAAADIAAAVAAEYQRERYWPEPLVQINPNYERSESVGDLVRRGLLHAQCERLFVADKAEGTPRPIELYTHQLEAFATAQKKKSFVVTTGTGSGKSLAFFLPIIDRVLRGRAEGASPRTRAIVIYPMNALANSQLEELEKFLCDYPEEARPFTVARYTGQEERAERERIARSPPDILLTNFMMLELILTRFEQIDRRVVENCRGLEFLVLDELHTYRGRQGADVAMLVRRLRQRLAAQNVLCIGTSATMSTTGSVEDQRKTVADVASKLFGAVITPHEVIGETLQRVTDESLDLAAIRAQLPGRMARGKHSWSTFENFKQDPLAVWTELTLGIDMTSLSKPRRATPCKLSEAAHRLAEDAHVAPEMARTALQSFLVAASMLRTAQGRAPFAFKLHQFISGPGRVMTTLEPEGARHITLDAQRFAPGRQQQGVLLYAAHFCRECGQEYHPVWRDKNGHCQPREIDDVAPDDVDTDSKPTFGFLAPRRSGQLYRGQLDDLPENWLDLTRAEPKIRPTYRNAVPQEQLLDATGRAGSGQAYVGPLMRPTTKADYRDPSFPKPAKLFSHNDQQSTWQAFAPEGAVAGWGGRMADLLVGDNGANAVFTSISASGNSVWLAGRQVLQYQVSTGGAIRIGGSSNSLFGSALALDKMRGIMRSARSGHLLEQDHAGVVGRSIDAEVLLSSNLPAADSVPYGTPGLAGEQADPLLQYDNPLTGLKAGNGLAQQLQAVARTISASIRLGVRRQVLLVSLGGFDTHESQNRSHTDLMARLSHALNYFDTTLTNLGLSQQVTTFTASDFGRTFTSNGDGTDHGWGAHHFVMGGAVRGGDLYGSFPQLGLSDGKGDSTSPNQIRNGAMLPSISVDQYAATLGRWFGLTDAQLLEVLPNLAHFDPATRNLGFMS